MVFRKLADVQREKELAERRKDDPPLDVSTDLAVRKLLSRLQRRTNENNRTISVSPTVELDEEPTGNSGGGGNAWASKPSAKLQFAKLLRGTVASVATSPVSPTTAATTSSVTPNNTPVSLDSSPTGRSLSRALTKPPGASI